MILVHNAEPQQYRNILRNPAVPSRTGLSTSQRWRLERRGEFPARVQLSEMAVGWYEDEVNEWIESRPRAGGKQPPLPKSRRQSSAACHSNGAINNVLDRRIDDELDLSVRASNALRNENIIVVGDLVERTQKDLLKIPNFGRVSLGEVESALAKLHLHLGMQHPASAAE
jgi:predicted DNA-binding transcriptional regulator AlpA